MSLILHVRGNDIELDAEAHSAQQVRHRLQQAKKDRMDYELGNGEDFYSPGQSGELRFKLEGGGETFFDTADVFGVSETSE